MSPIISIITPSLNSVRFIEQAILSVLGQNYPHFEHIIVDGGSTDGTVEILKKYSHLQWVSEPDKGQADAMNKGYRMAKGEVIVYLNADDFFEPGAFQAAVDLLDRDKSVYFVVGKCNVWNDDGKLVDWYLPPKLTYYEILQWWKFPFPINPSSYFYLKDVQETVGPFDVNNHYSMDYEFLLKAALHYKFFYIDRVLGNYRFITETKTHSTVAAGKQKALLAYTHRYWHLLSMRDYIRVLMSYSYFVASRTAFAGYLIRLKKLLKNLNSFL